MSFVLASQSPRRQELLIQIGAEFTVQAANIDETLVHQETAQAYVQRLALAKAKAIASTTAFPVMGADTIVVHQGMVFGKPQNEQEAIEMLSKLSGSEHTVYSAVALMHRAQSEVSLAKTKVYFKALDEPMIAAYCQTQEPYDKAGGYAIQGLAAVFIEKIIGNYSTVMGLPLLETAELLTKFGLSFGLPRSDVGINA